MPTSIPTSQSRIERLVREVPALVKEQRLDAVLQRVADLAAEVVGARYVAVGLLAPDRRTLDTFIVSGLSEEERRVIGPLPTGKGILGLLIKEGHPIRLADLGRHPASVGFPANHPPMRSFLGVPVVSPQGVIGELYLTEKIGAAEFSEEDEHIAVLLALTTASAVENARLHTDRSRLLEEVQQLHRSRERFFAMVNHELRNALAAALIRGLLDLGRLDEDRLKPVFRDLDAGAMIRGAIQRVTPAARERSVELRTDAAAESVLCRSDAHRVEQILVNLLRNAIRHSPPGTSVTGRVAPNGSTVVFQIDDHGPGIGPELAERIFDVYYTTAGEERQGQGLALPLPRRLARLLGGDL